MAVRRPINPRALARLAAAHKARVRRTVKQVRRGKLTIDEVEEDIRAEVDAKVKEKAKAKGGPG